ncbi:hypothetical protein EV424DRAFT_1537147 [Suillus variegatus]|nr:hypothetical protein EV424DRAFT_1537147 [Suillus variegatus]
MTNLFVAHTLGAPDYASGSSLFAGGATALGGSIRCCEYILDWLWNITYNLTLLEYEIQPRTTARSQPQTATPPCYDTRSLLRVVGFHRRAEVAYALWGDDSSYRRKVRGRVDKLPKSSDSSLLCDPAHRAYLTPHSPKPVQPTQPTKPDADIDPFEHELRGFDVPAAQVHGYNLSRNPRRASVDDENLDEDEEHSEELQLFPGSGLF